MNLRLYGGFSLRRAGKDYGWLLTLVVSVVALASAAWLANPVEQAADHVAVPVARSVGLVQGRCHSGWSDEFTGGDHALVYVCARGNWRVVLLPDGKTFDHAVELNKPGAQIIYDEAIIPGW